MTPETAAIKAKQDVGALLPDVDPQIGELVLTALYANPEAQVGVIAAGLARAAPSADIAGEMVSALIELVACREKGHLYWLETTGHSILVGVRKAKGNDALMFGTAKWPMHALLSGPPQHATVRVSGQRFARIYMASEPMDGMVVRQSEAVALGNAMIERFGGRIIEDRQGPETARQSFIEQNMTTRAKKRADAINEVERLLIESRTTVPVNEGYARVALAEAVPGSLPNGLRLHLQDKPKPVYIVDRRINDDYVLIVAAEKGAESDVEPGMWVREDGHPPAPGWDSPICGFTEDAAHG